jgi:cytochrome b
MKRILVWDIPTRLFHFLFALCFTIAWLTSVSDQWLSLHTFFGYLMLGLLGFRLVWGFTGGYYARFTSFLYSPWEGFNYLRDVLAKKAGHYLGHNPAGSQAIFMLLGLGLAVCLTGVLVQGGEEQHSVATGLVSISTGTLIKNAHEFLAILMLLLVCGHLAGATIDSWLLKENLPLSMVTGIKDDPHGGIPSRPQPLVGGLLVLAAAMFGLWWFFYAWHEPIEKRLGTDITATEELHVAFVGPKLPDNPKWREECGSCHLAFHPNLLPARSWKRMIEEQAQHFGTDLGFDTATSAALSAFMVANAAERSPTEAAFKINRSIKSDTTPLRITETPYWIDKHADIVEADWRLLLVKSKINCAACHQDAEAGTFEDAAMKIPRLASLGG